MELFRRPFALALAKLPFTRVCHRVSLALAAARVRWPTPVGRFDTSEPVPIELEEFPLPFAEMPFVLAFALGVDAFDVDFAVAAAAVPFDFGFAVAAAAVFDVDDFLLDFDGG